MEEHKTNLTEFEGYARFLREKDSVTQLPAFDPNWIGAKPRFIVEDKVMSVSTGTKVLHFPKIMSFAAAAILLFAIGVWISFRISKSGPEIVQGTPLKAVVVFVKGQVSVMRDVETKLHQGDLLNESDIVLTDAGGALDIGLTDSSVIRVKENSRLILKELRENDNGSQIRMNLASGRLLNVVEKEKKGSSFYIETASAVAAVRGTSFEVGASESESVIFVVEGAVEVTSLNAGGKVYILETAKRVTVNKDGEIESIDLSKLKSTLPEYKDMKKNLENLDSELLFDVRNLKSATTEEELSRIYDLSIERIIMKDGRELRGVVVSQKKGKLVVQTLKGSYILDEEAVDKIKY
ncbi:sigma factor regulatory protein, FecR/PupR family [Leptospira weilii serovar Ranarum str. ICFT]|uniref:Sigma factor regulatory protein, FecR/PupR family n=1 Tax=Leptospira weilii serovar Ranarum str. ICFT TaxID=1218598 RepID=N1WHS3_9LEPT|nr:FecR domain-containing protein [Leptospira weilii]EMY76689.1 sigma factor regulatory protein, FecR/PupR family [Leptospira weilii serovar Ranarum str. ICFT]